MDTSRLEFPTDALTLGEIRKARGTHQLTAERIESMKARDLRVMAAHRWELLLAEQIYEAELNLEPRQVDPTESRPGVRSLCQFLEGYYKSVGLVTGDSDAERILEGLIESVYELAEEQKRLHPSPDGWETTRRYR